MTCPNPDMNPFFHLPENDKEEIIIEEVKLEESTEDEDDMLDKAWGLEPDSRLSCQTVTGKDDLVIEIPKYTINQVTESR